MKMILLFTLALLCVPALADGPSDPCNIPQPPGITYPYADMLTAGSTYACAPTLSAVTVRINSAGVVAWWYCPTDKPGRYAANWAATTHGWLAEHALQSDLLSVVTSLDPLVSLNALTKKNADKPLSDPSLTPVWCPFFQEMADATPGGWNHPEDNPPPPGTWLTSGRSSYETANNSLTKFAGLVSTGLACDCASPIHAGTSTYCTFAGASKPSIVAQCKKAP